MHPLLVAVAAHERQAGLQAAAEDHRNRSSLARPRRARRTWLPRRAPRVAHA
jgi:hypothetical protein